MKSVHKIIQTEKEIDTLIQYCKQTGYCSMDFETTGVCFYLPSEYPTSISISFQPGSSYIIPLGHPESPFIKTYPQILKKLGKQLIEDKDVIKIGWNLKFEYKWLFNYGIKFRGRVFDAMLMKHLLDEERPHDLKSMVTKYLPEFGGYEDAVKGKKHNEMPLEVSAKYNGLDSDLTLRLALWFEGKLLGMPKLYRLYRNLVCIALRTVTNMEWHGTLVDEKLLDELIIKYQALSKSEEKKLRNHKLLRRFEKWLIEERKEKYIESLSNESKIAKIQAGEFTTKKELKIIEPVNFSSPKQMAEFFFSSPMGLELDPIKTNDSGSFSTDEETLKKLALKEEDGGFINALLEFRGLEKLTSTYLVNVKAELYEGKRYPGYLIHGTKTGRYCIGGETILPCNIGDIRIKDICPNREALQILQEEIKILTPTGKYQKILTSINKGKEEMFRVELENGKTIDCTMNHQFLTPLGWKTLREINNQNLEIFYDERNP